MGWIIESKLPGLCGGGGAALSGNLGLSQCQVPVATCLFPAPGSDLHLLKSPAPHFWAVMRPASNLFVRSASIYFYSVTWSFFMWISGKLGKNFTISTQAFSIPVSMGSDPWLWHLPILWLVWHIAANHCPIRKPRTGSEISGQCRQWLLSKSLYVTWLS